MKRKQLSVLATLILVGGALASCQDKTSSSSSSSEASSSSSAVTNSLEMALTDAKADNVLLSGSIKHTYDYDNASLKTRHTDRTSTYKVSFEKSAWSTETLDSGVGTVPYYSSYFKDEGGYLSTEYLNYDNTIVLKPVLTAGVKELFDAKYENPFKLLSESDFVKSGEKYTLSGDKAQMFVSHAFDEAFDGGTITFTVENNKFTTISGADFTTNDYLYASNGSFARTKALEFELTFGGTTSIYHESAEKDKGYTTLATALKATEAKNFRIRMGSTADDVVLDVYFVDGTILASFGIGATEPSESDLYLTPDKDGMLQGKVYGGSDLGWLDSSEFEMFTESTTFDNLAPKFWQVSSNVFNKSSYSDSETYTSVSNGTRYLGENFFTKFFEYYPLTSYESFRVSLSTLTLTNVTETSFTMSGSAYTKGNGFEVRESTTMIVDQIGTCKLPYTPNTETTAA